MKQLVLLLLYNTLHPKCEKRPFWFHGSGEQDTDTSTKKGTNTAFHHEY